MSERKVQGTCVDCGATIYWSDSVDMMSGVRVRDSHLCPSCRAKRFKR